MRELRASVRTAARDERRLAGLPDLRVRARDAPDLDVRRLYFERRFPELRAVRAAGAPAAAAACAAVTDLGTRWRSAPPRRQTSTSSPTRRHARSMPRPCSAGPSARSDSRNGSGSTSPTTTARTRAEAGSGSPPTAPGSRCGSLPTPARSRSDRPGPGGRRGQSWAITPTTTPRSGVGSGGRPQEPLSYLSHIGVAPERQGEGIGTALMHDGLARADRDGVAAWLETSKATNAAYYEASASGRWRRGRARRRPAHLVHAPRPDVTGSVTTDSTPSTPGVRFPSTFGKGVRDAQGIARRSDRGVRRGGVGGGGDLLPTAGRHERRPPGRRRRADGGRRRGGPEGGEPEGEEPEGEDPAREAAEHVGVPVTAAAQGSITRAEARVWRRASRLPDGPVRSSSAWRTRGSRRSPPTRAPRTSTRCTTVSAVPRRATVSRHPHVRARLREQRRQLGSRDLPVSVLGREVAVRPGPEGGLERRGLRHVHERLRHDVQQVRRPRCHVEHADRGVCEAGGRQAVDRREPQRNRRLHRVRDRLRRVGGRLPQRRYVLLGTRSS